MAELKRADAMQPEINRLRDLIPKPLPGQAPDPGYIPQEKLKYHEARLEQQHTRAEAMRTLIMTADPRIAREAEALSRQVKAIELRMGHRTGILRLPAPEDLLHAEIDAIRDGRRVTSYGEDDFLTDKKLLERKRAELRRLKSLHPAYDEAVKANVADGKAIDRLQSQLAKKNTGKLVPKNMKWEGVQCPLLPDKLVVAW